MRLEDGCVAVAVWLACAARGRSALGEGDGKCHDFFLTRH